jgi:hypothetical protein
MNEPASDEGPSALVQEADCSERVVVLKIRAPGRTSFLLVAATRAGGGAGLLPQGARQELWGGKLPPGASRQRGREDALAKARIVAVVGAEIFFEPWTARQARADAAADADADDTTTTAQDLGRGDRALSRSAGATEQDANAHPALGLRCLRVTGGRVVITEAPLPAGATMLLEVTESERAALEARGLALAVVLAEDAIELRRDELARALVKSRQRIERRRAAIGEDLAKIAQADQIAAQAQWLVGEAARAPRGATKLVVTDWSTGEAVTMEVPLDLARSARDQVAAMFKRAKRLKLGGRIAAERLAQTEAQARDVTSALDALRDATSLPAIEAAAREAKRAAPRDVVLPSAGADGDKARGAPRGAPAARGAPPGRRVAFRTFTARSGTTIFVGKGAADNDTLTLKIARPHDLWLHAKDRTGAHVIVPLEKQKACPAEDLVDAAHLAAHFSDARDERAVDVQYTPRRYLRKPKGSPAGLVVVDREKVLALRFDPALLRALLEREVV